MLALTVNWNEWIQVGSGRFRVEGIKSAGVKVAFDFPREITILRQRAKETSPLGARAPSRDELIGTIKQCELALMDYCLSEDGLEVHVANELVKTCSELLVKCGHASAFAEIPECDAVDCAKASQPRPPSPMVGRKSSLTHFFRDEWI
jgi:hypothetical protein